MITDNIAILKVISSLHKVQIMTHGNKYTCPTKYVDGKLMFKFKREWLRAADYCNDSTQYLG